jgi:hypothetical protein
MVGSLGPPEQIPSEGRGLRGPAGDGSLGCRSPLPRRLADRFLLPFSRQLTDAGGGRFTQDMGGEEPWMRSLRWLRNCSAVEWSRMWRYNSKTTRRPRHFGTGTRMLMWCRPSWRNMVFRPLTLGYSPRAWKSSSIDRPGHSGSGARLRASHSLNTFPKRPLISDVSPVAAIADDAVVGRSSSCLGLRRVLTWA